MAVVRIHEAGRVIVADLGPGERLPDALAGVASDAGVAFATVSFSGTLASARLVLGERKYTRASADPDRVSFSDERLVIGSGTVVPGGDGYEVRLRATIGLEREVFVAEVVEAVVGGGLQVVLLEGRTTTAAQPEG